MARPETISRLHAISEGVKADAEAAGNLSISPIGEIQINEAQARTLSASGRPVRWRSPRREEAQTYTLDDAAIMNIAQPADALDRSSDFARLALRDQIARAWRLQAGKRGEAGYARDASITIQA